jgi:predicted metalloprotease with PDZ domain
MAIRRQLIFEISTLCVKFLLISDSRTGFSDVKTNLRLWGMANLRALAASFLFVLLPLSGNAIDSGSSPLTITLRPAAADSGQRVPYVDITVSYATPSVAAEQALLKMPLLTSNVVTVAKTIEDLSVTDASGPVGLTVKDDPESGEVTYRHWIASRATQGTLTVRYRAPISNAAAPRGAAPPLELRSDSGTFSGAGATFLLLPEEDSTQPIQIRWDLSAMTAGALGVSSFGKGDVATGESKGPNSLRSCYFMAGKVELFPENPLRVGFFSVWHGSAPFDLRELMSAEEKLYAFYGKFFRRPPTAPYGVFLRENPVNAGGGMELSGSFVATFGPKTKLDELKITLAHEMLHTFVGSLDQPEGLVSSWYSEGMAVYYARRLSLRAGQITPAQFLDDLNTTAGRYYTDALIATPNAEIPVRFWSDTRVRVLPYDRGSMYLAVVDEEVRAASDGKRSLDDLLLAMLNRRKQKLPVDEASWVDLATKELGKRGKTEFEGMLAGATQLPEPGGFGPCFTRTTKMLRRYQLGFEPKVLIEPKRIVRGLIPGSAAQRAGVRDGDEITQPVPQDRIQGEQDGVLTLKLLRDGKPLEFSYVPRGEAVEAYQWIRSGNLPDSACGF